MTTRALSGAIAIWLVLVGAGGYAIYHYEATAGAVATSGATWPAGSALARARDRPTVLMFAHPECGCTAASLAELAIAVDAAAAPPRVLVVFVGAFSDAALAASDNWTAAGRITGAIRIHVAGGPAGEARRFGARTSGHVAVYDARGALVFSGGITGARGHAGDNVGRRAVIAALRGAASAPAVHAVFGCSLEDAS
ncbi:MAG TPA: hypothetical protein VFP84_40450 [Kofleriaceae bacterium]|nr:hypothetical protein [Kofleriaceae bacterium]